MGMITRSLADGIASFGLGMPAAALHSSRDSLMVHEREGKEVCREARFEAFSGHPTVHTKEQC